MSQEEINHREWANPDNWSVGFYFSKKDSRTWVPKQIPVMGWTLNVANRNGALWLIGFLVGIPLFISIIMLAVIFLVANHAK